MNAKIEAVKKFTGQGFVSGIVVAALVGERRNISPISALRLRLGRLVWGTSTGLSKGGTAITLPDETFYEIADRGIGYAVSDQVQLNLIRAQMVRVEARVLKAAMIALFLLSAGVGAAVIFGAQIVENFHFSKISRSEPGISESDMRLMQSDARGVCSYSNSPSESCANYVLDTCKGQFSEFKASAGDAYTAVQPPCFVHAASAYAATH